MQRRRLMEKVLEEWLAKEINVKRTRRIGSEGDEWKRNQKNRQRRRLMEKELEEQATKEINGKGTRGIGSEGD